MYVAYIKQAKRCSSGHNGGYYVRDYFYYTNIKSEVEGDEYKFVFEVFFDATRDNASNGGVGRGEKSSS